MSFLTPYMLWGALAAGIPIALHFFYRSRYRKLPWAAMEFLLTSIEQTSRRLRFQELLLLLCRIMVLVLLALALARPSTSVSRGSARGDAVDAVFVVDTSASMDAREGAKTRLEQVRAAALTIVDNLPAHSTVQVIVCSDRAALLGPRSPSNLDQGRQVIDGLQVSHQASDLLPGIKESAGVLARGHSPNKELYVFSDNQKLAWEQHGVELKDELEKLSKTATVYLVRAGTRTPRNVAVVGIVPQSGIPHTGSRAGFAVLLRNSGAEPLRNLRVTLTVDGNAKEKETQPVIELAGGETRPIPMSVKLDRAGLRILSAQVEADELDADNRFDQVLFVRDQVRVLVVDGSPNEQKPERGASFFLMHTLAPIGNYHVYPRALPAGQAAAAQLANQDIVVLADVSLETGVERRADSVPGDFVRHLSEFVKRGHGLIVFAGDNVNPKTYNRILHDRYKLLPLPLADLLTIPADKPLHLNRQSVESPFFAEMRENEDYRSLNRVVVKKALGVVEATPAKDAKETKDSDAGPQVLLRYSNGKPALVSRKVGQGEVLLFTTAGHPAWNETGDIGWTDWPVSQTYLPVMDMALNHLLHGQTQNHNGPSGEPLRWQPEEKDAGRAFAVLQPDGRRVRLGLPTTEKGRAVVSVNDTAHAGIYRVVPADETPDTAKDKSATGVPFAVTCDVKETQNLESLTNAELDRKLGFPVIHLTAGDDPSAFAGGERLKSEWTMWLLAAVLAFVLIETVLAWICGRAW
ncbi:MAG: BatA domain-containing protein [Planctomycetia bacterium]|nr:BatA domain-containing protein [Planctomycetia bacterium]